MIDLPEELDGARKCIVLSALTARAQALVYAPLQGDSRHWFLAFAEDLKAALIEAGVPESVMDDQDVKHGDDND